MARGARQPTATAKATAQIAKVHRGLRHWAELRRHQNKTWRNKLPYATNAPPSQQQEPCCSSSAEGREASHWSAGRRLTLLGAGQAMKGRQLGCLGGGPGVARVQRQRSQRCLQRALTVRGAPGQVGGGQGPGGRVRQQGGGVLDRVKLHLAAAQVGQLAGQHRRACRGRRRKSNARRRVQKARHACGSTAADLRRTQRTPSGHPKDGKHTRADCTPGAPHAGQSCNVCPAQRCATAVHTACRHPKISHLPGARPAARAHVP